MKLLMWDFDNTLAYREGQWSGTLLDVLTNDHPQHTVTRDQLRAHLQAGFPWHTPDVVHPHLACADAWWSALYPVFVRAYCACGIEADTAYRLAQLVRGHYCDVRQWRLFADVLPTLR